MEFIRQKLDRYHRTSPAHFELAVKVHQLRGPHTNDDKVEANVTTKVDDILLEGNTVEGRISIAVGCRTIVRLRRSRYKVRGCTIINEDGSSQSLADFLSSNFPIIDGPLCQNTLWHWWLHNGKTFNWAALPTELKERIIGFCMHQPYSYGIYEEKLTRFQKRYENDRKVRKPGPYEIVDQLGDWYQLLYVSHQVRAITLRLCITGGSSLASKGLCITSSSLRSFSECMDRLGDYYQMTEQHSVPTNAKEQALSKCYSRYPRIYPELHQYATLRHGIQKISLGMDFLSAMHFFKVQARDFQRFCTFRDPTYEILERLPNLNEIVIRLPLRPRKGWRNNPYAGGPPLFHHESPCPRILHRFIYERIAEALASFEKVTVRNFIDVNEEQQFLAARTEAIKALKFTKLDLQELYAASSGGVELPDRVERGAISLEKVREGDAEIGNLRIGFTPPSCHCEEPCILSHVFMISDHHG